MYKELTLEDIVKGVVYVSANELREMVGVSNQTLNYHVNTDVIDAYRYRNRTFFLPNDVEQYVHLHEVGLIKRQRK